MLPYHNECMTVDITQSTHL